MMNPNELKILQSRISVEIQEFRTRIKQVDTATRQTFRFLENELCGSIEVGYELYLKSISETNNEDNGISTLEQGKALLNWDFSRIIEQNKARQVLLDEIVRMLHIPEVEKERKLFIEKGLNFFKKADSNAQFYADSKLFYEKALKYDDLDYYVLYNLGLIHLFATHFTDPKQAAIYFGKAALYAQAEISYEKISDKNYSSILDSGISPMALTVNAFIYQARCFFIIGNENKTLETIDKAIGINPKDTSALYDKLKYVVSFKQTDEIERLLLYIIRIDHFMVLRVLKDIELLKVETIKKVLMQQKSTACNEARMLVDKCRSIISEKSPFYNDLLAAEIHLEKDNYLSAMEALNILN